MLIRLVPHWASLTSLGSACPMGTRSLLGASVALMSSAPSGWMDRQDGVRFF
jgi:hypothetical protein